MTIKPQYQSKNVKQAASHLAEECAEVLEAFCKAQRFGWQSVNPELKKDEHETNQDWFIREVRDVKRAIQAFEEQRIMTMGKNYKIRKIRP